MIYKISVVVELDEHGFYAYCPGLPGCQTQGETIEEAMKNIHEAAELYLETLSDKERPSYLSKEVLTTAIEVSLA